LTPLRLSAPAKLNLSLRVVGRRDDGFHELDGVMVLIDLADRLLVLPGCSGLRVTDAGGVPVDGVPVRAEENLAWRGLAAGLGGSPDDAMACLTLEKRIPAAAGLGGGSADAGAGWRLGRRWLGRPEAPDAGELEVLGRLGADIPFFAAATAAARVRGIGDQVEPLPAALPTEVVLVHPPRALETASVFSAARPTDWSDEAATDIPTALSHGRNDLEAAARRRMPELGEIASLLEAAGGRPRMSGSGPTLFSLEDDPERADAIARRVEQGGVRVTRTRTLATAATIEPIDEEEG
jgi:4-diphosphocytidyl-2-C-methyl-D-erythritol kinase